MIWDQRVWLLIGLAVGVCVAAVIMLNGFVLALGVGMVLVAWYLQH